MKTFGLGAFNNTTELKPAGMPK